MSLNYSLSLALPANTWSLDNQLRQISMPPDTAVWSRHLAAPGSLETAMLKEAFGFTPGVTLTLQRVKQADPLTARKQLIQLCLAILNTNPSDAVLLFNGERVIMRRHQGQWILNNTNGFWTEEILATMPRHQRQNMPDL